MSKFTPAPWELDYLNSNNKDNGIYITDNLTTVCDFYFKSGSGRIVDFPNAKANAHLICAAPDMYGALKPLEDYANEMDELQPTWSYDEKVASFPLYYQGCIARSTLKKARGEVEVDNV